MSFSWCTQLYKKKFVLNVWKYFFFALGFLTKIITFILFYIFIEIYRIWIQSEINRAEDYVSDKSWLITRVKHWQFLIRKFSVMFIWKLFKWQAMCEIQFIVIVFLINWHFLVACTCACIIKKIATVIKIISTWPNMILSW